jgi:phage terminase Nu1 subunit (DNA packaging protein)
MQKSRAESHDPSPKGGNLPGLPDFLSQSQLAEMIGVTPRQVRNLEDAGLPSEPGPRGKVYPRRACRDWYLAFKEEAAIRRVRQESPTSLEDERVRLVAAQASLAELDLEQRRGGLVTVEDHIRHTERTLLVLRARLLNLPGMLAPRVVGLRSLREADAVLRGEMDAIFTELQKSATDLETFDDEEAE